jgi:hypothetical protein
MKNMTDPDLVNVKAVVDTGLRRKVKKKKTKKVKKATNGDMPTMDHQFTIETDEEDFQRDL